MQPDSQAAETVSAEPTTEKRKYLAPVTLIFSFFYGELYRDVALRWRGIGFRYLAMLVLLTSAAEAYKVHKTFNDYVRRDAPAFVENCPTLSIQDGQLIVAEPEPYIWRDPSTRDPDSRKQDPGKVFLYVDTRGIFDQQEAIDAPLRLSQNGLEIRAYSPHKTLSLAEIQNDLTLLGVKSASLDKVQLKAILQWCAKWIGITYFGAMMIAGIVGHFLQIVCYAMLTMAVCGLLGLELRFAAYMRLVTVALTPAMLLGTILFVSGISIPWPFGGLSLFVIGVGYVVFAAKENFPIRPPMVEE